MQTASLMRSIELPLLAQAGKDFPEVSDYMPGRYHRPKKRASSELFVDDQTVQQQAEQVKAMFGAMK